MQTFLLCLLVGAAAGGGIAALRIWIDKRLSGGGGKDEGKVTK